MTPIERRTLDELRARYDLEPTLQDVYVEGSFDREVISRCLQANGQTGRIVYEIDSVEVPPAILRREGLTDGNKQRLIALARALDSFGREIGCRCLVDRDLDQWFGPLEVRRTLVWTEHCSIELYFFADELLKEMLLIAAKAQIENWPSFISSMTSALLDLFSMRLADRELEWSMEWLPLRKHLASGASDIKFDPDEYIVRLLMKNGRAGSREDFRAARARWRSALSGDPRKSIRGHDLVEILCWAIRAFRGLREMASQVAVERIFLLAAPRASGLSELLPPTGD